MSENRSQFLGRAVGRLCTCLLLAGGMLSGCEKQPAPAPAAKDASDARTYVVRGRVESLPVAGVADSEFEVHHEAIPEFVGRTGKLGMSSMVMPFPLGSGVSVADVAVGDVVEVTFVVTYTPRTRFEATRVRRLPPDTVLNFGRADGGEAPAKH
ncbi:MAG: copper-binding protein [Phycisphaeraceae bacterium]|nr:copper-binding protein [Phycisphaeraceae bacterium]